MATTSETVFQRLRPCCVRLSQLSVQAQAGGKADVKELNSVLGELHAALSSVERLDDALCDYVLFPIRHVFRQASTLPSSVMALALQCLCILIKSGQSIASKPAIVTELLVLFMTLLHRQVVKLPKKTANEPETLAVCRCLRALLSKKEPDFPPAPSSGSDPRMVITGNLLADLLDVSSSEQVSAARIPALKSIELLMSYEKSGEIVRRFLPGILSTLTKPQFTSAIGGVSYKALLASIGVLRTVLPRAVHRAKGEAKKDTDSDKGDPVRMWLSSSSSHLKAAIQNILKLQAHDRLEVKKALFDLCMALLQEEPISSEVTNLLLDSSVRIACDGQMPQEEARLAEAVTDDAELRTVFFQTANKTIEDLPSTLQFVEGSKREAMMKAAQSYIAVASRISAGLDDLSGIATEAVFDCVRLLESSSKVPTSIPNISFSEELIVVDSHQEVDDVFADTPSARSDTKMLRGLLETIMRSRFAASVFDVFTDGSPLTYGQAGLSKLWTLATCLDLSANLKLNDTLHAYRDAALSSAYDNCLALLDKAPASSDWRLQALSLDIVASYALDSGQAFRPELSFVLYPVVERIAGRDDRLRQHASRALATISRACGYTSIQDILLQNADYLVNAVSIRLTDLEPRPEAARVLQAAIKLGGAPMLPHLGDVTECVFSVLDSYHGYPEIVDSMFSALGTMIDQAPVREASSSDVGHLHQSGHQDVSSIIDRIRRVGKMDELATSADLNDDNDGDNTTGEDDDGTENEVGHTPGKTEKAVTGTVERIVRYGQYFLTYETPEVRRGLLDVLRTGFVALRHDENVLLPIINDLWPVMISRVYDPEPYVSIGALESMRAMIECAGEFMSSRVEDEWDRLRSFALQHRPKRAAAKSGSSKAVAGSGRLTFTSSGKIWEAALETITAIVLHTRVTAAMEDDLFRLAADHLSESKGLEEALAKLNADALWLTKFMTRADQRKELTSGPPSLPGFTFAPLPASQA